MSKKEFFPREKSCVVDFRCLICCMDTYERAGEGEVLMKRRRYDMPVLRKVNNACDIVSRDTLITRHAATGGWNGQSGDFTDMTTVKE